MVCPCVPSYLFRIAIRVFRKHGRIPCGKFIGQPAVNLRLPILEIGSFQRVSDDIEQKGIVAYLKPLHVTVANGALPVRLEAPKELSGNRRRRLRQRRDQAHSVRGECRILGGAGCLKKSWQPVHCDHYLIADGSFMDASRPTNDCWYPEPTLKEFTLLPCEWPRVGESFSPVVTGKDHNRVFRNLRFRKRFHHTSNLQSPCP